MHLLTAEKQMALLMALSKENVSKELTDKITLLMDYIQRLESAIRDHKRTIDSMIRTQDDNERFAKAAFDKIKF